MTELAPILSLIPQRPPFLLVDRLVAYTPTEATSEFEVRPECPLCHDGMLSESGMVENIAQTCAAYIGYRNLDQEVKIGVIGAIKQLEIMTQPRIGQTISTTINIEADMFGMLLVKSRTHGAGGELLSACEMKISLIE